jgi:hypothetical protein
LMIGRKLIRVDSSFPHNDTDPTQPTGRDQIGPWRGAGRRNPDHS